MFLYKYFTDTTFYIYSRNKENDSYELKYSFDNSGISKFKHSVYAYALYFTPYRFAKSIYLYSGYHRIAKSIRNTVAGITYLTITFDNEKTMDDWDTCDEEIDGNHWLQPGFKRLWASIDTDNPLERKYLNFKA